MKNHIKISRIKGNLPFFLTIFFFAAGYLFFFTSNLWMPVTSAATALTPVGQVKIWNGRKIEILRWDYCEGSREMEVELSVENTTFDGQNVYRYSAMDSKGNLADVGVIIEEDDWIILRLKNVPKRWSEMMLRMEVDGQEEPLKLYTNIKEVEKVKGLPVKDWNGYRKGRFERQIEKYAEQIRQKQEKIQDLMQEQQQITGEIQRLQKDKKFQTEEEQEDTDETVKEARQKNAEDKQMILTLQEEIRELKEKSRLTEEQMEEVLEDE